MNLNDPASLPLRDIVLPSPVPWWPLAAGWWYALLAIALAAAAAVFLWRRHRRQRPRREALLELAEIEREIDSGCELHHCACALSRLARRLCMSQYGDAAAANTGSRRLDDLQRLAGETPTETVQSLFVLAPYSATEAAAMRRADAGAAINFLRKAILRLGISGRHVSKNA